MDSGASLYHAIEYLTTQPDLIRIKNVLQKILKDLENNIAFSEAIGKHSKIFSNFYCGIFKSSDTYDKTEYKIKKLNSYFNKNVKLHEKITKTLLEFIITLTGAIVGILLIILLIVPKISTTLTQSQIALPKISKLLISMSQNTSVSIMLTSIFFLFLFIFFYIFKLLFIRKIIRKFTISNICCKMSLLSVANSDSSQFLKTVIDIPPQNMGISQKKTIKNLGDLISNSNIFPQIICLEITDSIKNNNLEQTCKNVSSFYEEDITAELDAFMVTTKPLIIIILGMITAVIISLTYLPIFNFLLNNF